jgi:hypothetical protein
MLSSVGATNAAAEARSRDSRGWILRDADEKTRKQALRDAAREAELLQREAASLLYSRLISPGGSATVPMVAEALGVGQSTVYRQCSGDIPVQLRTLAALALVDIEGFKALLDLVGRQLGMHWKWNLTVPVPPDGDAAFQAVAEVSLACSEAAMMEYMALRDGKVTPDEMSEMDRRWRIEDYKKELMRAQIRAMAGDSVKTAPRAAGTEGCR